MSSQVPKSSPHQNRNLLNLLLSPHTGSQWGGGTQGSVHAKQRDKQPHKLTSHRWCPPGTENWPTPRCMCLYGGGRVCVIQQASGPMFTFCSYTFNSFSFFYIFCIVWFFWFLLMIFSCLLNNHHRNKFYFHIYKSKAIRLIKHRCVLIPDKVSLPSGGPTSSQHNYICTRNS